MVLPYINMNLPRVYTCSPSWTPLPPPSTYHPTGSSQCTSPKHPVSCIEPGLAIHFTYDNIHVSMPFSQTIPPHPLPESKRLVYTSVSLLLSCIQGYHSVQFSSVAQSCPTLCDPIDSSPRGSPVPGILQARTLEWVAISFSNALTWKMKVKSQSCPTCSNPMDCSLPGSSTHGIFQARVPEWGAIAFSDFPYNLI